MSDDEFLAAFDETTLPAAAWTHAAHVRMAYLKFTRLPDGEALAAIRSGIQRYNAAQGNHPGYHETITVAFARLIADRMGPADPRPWPEFAAEHPELMSPAALERHYSRETLFSAEARAAFVPPDREPLP